MRTRPRVALYRGEDGTLRLAWRAERNTAEPVGDGAESAALLDGVAGLEIAYSSGAGVWSDAWLDRTAMPRLVRVRVIRADGLAADRGAAWPDLVAAPRTDVDAGCLPDPFGSGCRGR